MMSRMSQEREELLLAMSLVARDEAHKHLSEAGSEVLEIDGIRQQKPGDFYCRGLRRSQRHR